MDGFYWFLDIRNYFAIKYEDQKLLVSGISSQKNIFIVNNEM